VNESPYQAIKRSITGGIASGRYAPGQILPSEHELCRSFGVARMTVNRAMRELAAEQVVRRVPGVGTFVAEPVAQSGLVEIRNIADEIAARGNKHRSAVFALAAMVPSAPMALAFELPPGAILFHSAVLHFENEVPIQYEERLIDPALAPDYLAQDFSFITPAQYLNFIAPVQEVEHVVQAVAPDAAVAGHLALAPGEPCLLVTRRTWSAGRLAAHTKLFYPGSRFRLSGRFVPSGAQATVPKVPDND
jgi:GntR family transcriptional regulator, histidine utilization repressor